MNRLKQCTGCKQQKEISNFHKNKLYKGGLQSQCKDCLKEYRLQNKDKIKKYRREYYNNIEKLNSQTESSKEHMKEYRKKHKARIAKSRKKHYEKNKSEILKKRKEYQREYNLKNKEKLALQRKHRDKKNIAHIRKQKKERYKNDICYKLSSVLRSRVLRALKTDSKGRKTFDLIGCTVKEFKCHIEGKFKEGMTWENYGRDGWHVDHIRPCASFDLSDPEQQKLCFHYTNTQPMWAIDNLTKGDKYKLD